MAAAKTRVDKAALVNAWLTKPAVIYALVGLLLVGAVYWLIPDLYQKGKEAGAKLFGDLRDGINGVFDNTLSAIADITGRPQSQDPGKRDGNDWAQGLVVDGDRALSDAWDTFTTW